MKKKHKKEKQTNLQDVTPQYPKEDTQEDKSQELFLSRLDENRFIDVPMGKKYPGIDGIIRILDENRRMTGYQFNYQLRSTRDTQKNYEDCKHQFLNLCKINSIPVILVFVNLDTEIVFWEHIDSYYIENFLHLKKSAKYRRIKFKNSKVIIKGDNFLGQCFAICQKKDEVRQKQERFEKKKFKNPELKDKSPIAQYPRERFKEEATAIIENRYASIIKERTAEKGIKKERKQIFQELYYLAFVYFLKKIYTDEQGKKEREKIRQILSISEKEEKLSLEKLKGLDLVEQTHNLITLKNKNLGKYALKELIEKEEVDLENITSLFLTQNYE